MIIRAANSQDEIVWRSLWMEYNAFYGVEVPENVTAATWKRIIDSASEIKALLVIDEEHIIGFANYVLHPYTWSEGSACLMDDLFVSAEARGQGAGNLLINTLINMSKENNWTRIYWMTREGNSKARRLYDKFCKSDGFVRYTLSIDGITCTLGNS